MVAALVATAASSTASEETTADPPAHMQTQPSCFWVPCSASSMFRRIVSLYSAATLSNVSLDIQKATVTSLHDRTTLLLCLRTSPLRTSEPMIAPGSLQC